MTWTRKIESDLEDLRQELPDPFHLAAKLEDFFNSSKAQELIAEAETSIRRILAFLYDCQDPDLARVAVLLLSYFDPSKFYSTLLSILKKADKPIAEAFEPGLWLIKIPEKQIAQNLIGLVSSSGNPNPLLLLQKPIAKEVRVELADFIRQHQLPLSLYALYCYEYTLDKSDISLMQEISQWVDVPEICSLAGLYLLKLESKAGCVGIKAGLTASDVQLRELIYYELCKYIPKSVLNQAKYIPTQPVDSLESAVRNLINYLQSSE